eukprot:1457404-Amphidinium_carterae.1
MNVCSLDLCECGAERAEELGFEDLSGLRTGFDEIPGATPTAIDHEKLNPKQKLQLQEHRALGHLNKLSFCPACVLAD